MQIILLVPCEEKSEESILSHVQESKVSASNKPPYLGLSTEVNVVTVFWTSEIFIPETNG